MGRWQTLMARDGHEFSAYLAAPTGAPRGAVVVLQEIFGVNEHIRRVVEQYAAAGFLTIAPALFDRVGRNIELGYGPKDMEQGVGYRLQIDDAKALLDIGAAVNVVHHAGTRRAGRLLLGRAARPGSARARCACRRRSAITPAASGRSSIACRPVRSCCTMASSTRTSRASASSRCARCSRRPSIISIRPITASTATRAPATTRPAPQLAWERTQEFLKQHIG